MMLWAVNLQGTFVGFVRANNKSVARKKAKSINSLYTVGQQTKGFRRVHGRKK